MRVCSFHSVLSTQQWHQLFIASDGTEGPLRLISSAAQCFILYSTKSLYIRRRKWSRQARVSRQAGKQTRRKDKERTTSSSWGNNSRNAVHYWRAQIIWEAFLENSKGEMKLYFMNGEGANGRQSGFAAGELPKSNGDEIDNRNCHRTSNIYKERLHSTMPGGLIQTGYLTSVALKIITRSVHVTKTSILLV